MRVMPVTKEPDGSENAVGAQHTKETRAAVSNVPELRLSAWCVSALKRSFCKRFHQNALHVITHNSSQYGHDVTVLPIAN